MWQLLAQLQNWITNLIWDDVIDQFSVSQCRDKRLQNSWKKWVYSCKLFSSGPTAILPDYNYLFWFCPLESWVASRAFLSLLCGYHKSFLGKLFSHAQLIPRNERWEPLEHLALWTDVWHMRPGLPAADKTANNPNRNHYLPLSASTGFKLASI